MGAEPFRWIGKSLPRVEDERLLRGAGYYIDDLSPFPGCKVAAILRSPHAHATISSIDVQEALETPGVAGVITGADVRREMRPFPVGVPAPVEYYPLAIEKVQLLGFSPLAFKMGKRALHAALETPLSAGLILEGSLYGFLRTTEDFQEGVQAFKEKRRPKFQGK